MNPWISRRLLDAPFAIALFIDEKSFKRECKRLKLPDIDYLASPRANATCHLYEKTNSRDAVALVCLGSTKGLKLEQIYAMLVHEAVHIWQHSIESIREKYPSDEMEAYAIQSISQNLMFAYKDITRKSHAKRN